MCECTVTTWALPTLPAYFITTSCCLLLSLCSPVQNVLPECRAPAVLLNEVCNGGKKPASLQTWRSGSPVCPSPSFPTALLLKQNCFQAVPLCTECCGGRDLSWNSCSLFILERLQRHWLGLNVDSYINCEKSTFGPATHPINYLQNACIDVQSLLGSFLPPWEPGAVLESYLKWRSTEIGEVFGVFFRASWPSVQQNAALPGNKQKQVAEWKN